MKIKIEFDDDEYIFLAKSLLEYGIDLPMIEDGKNAYPIAHVVDSSSRCVYIVIYNTNLTKDLINLILDLTKDEAKANTVLDLIRKYSSIVTITVQQE